ncbi:uncharacterized protein LOC131214380 [Anopheles bellator]|uniref:uncharacterized protein LOC131214380 n=1 Tax=Anopheles bellator TaxID=139047 RepID=UPI0026486C62|nr:uncharacterized protein LOC131214380 [Anopheles bellator]
MGETTCFGRVRRAFTGLYTSGCTVWAINCFGRIRRAFTGLYTEHNIYLPTEMLLAITGFHLADRWKRRYWVRWAFQATRLIELLQYLMWVDRFYLSVLDASVNPGKTLHCTNGCGLLTMCLVRVLVFGWYMEDVKRTTDYLQRQREQSVPSDSYRKIVNYALVCESLGLADRAMYYFSRSYREDLYEIPANILALGRHAELGAFLVNFDFSFRWSATYNVSFTIMNTLLIGLYDELACIAADYGQLFAGNAAPQRLRGTFDWDQLERHIARTVHRHEVFQGQLSNIKPFLRTAFLLMFYAAVQLLTLGAFMISVNGITTYGVILVGFLTVVIFECYWCCRLVDRLNDMNASIGTLLYSLDWPTKLRYSPRDASRYRQARTSLSIIFSKTQNGLNITGGGMFEICSEAFARLMKISYTLLMFLRDTQRRSFR